MREHLLITHFDLRKFPSKVTLLDKTVKQNAEWLEHRLELFDTWCFPSVVMQNNPNFKWLICLDAHTPPWVISQFQKYKAQFDKIHIIFANRAQALNMKPLYTRHIDPKADSLITTRLDTDDAIHENFVDLVQYRYPTQKTVLYFNKGYVFCKDEYYEVSRRGNHYLSFYEPYQDGMSFVGCYADHHRNMMGYGQLIEDYREPVWIEVHHENNLFNKLHYNDGKRAELTPVSKPEGFNV